MEALNFVKHEGEWWPESALRSLLALAQPTRGYPQKETQMPKSRNRPKQVRSRSRESGSRKRLRASRTEALERNKKYFRVIAALCIEAEGSVNLSASTLNLLDDRDELRFEEAHPGFWRISYVPFREAEAETPPDSAPLVEGESRSEQHQLGQSGEADGVRLSDADVEEPLRGEEAQHSGDSLQAEHSPEHSAERAGEERNHEPPEGRSELPEGELRRSPDAAD
jgi:hypothetical protein